MRVSRIVYIAAILLSSALLFLIQPLAARLLLPTFGGSPQVWSASMLFFQLLLLGGYAYAHYSNLWLTPARQRFVHIGLLVAAALTLPFTNASGFFDRIRQAAPETNQPAGLVLMALAGTVGLVFFAISSNSPLIQRWFSTTDDPKAKSPYFLYAASNLGSMVGLVAYPFLFEPLFGLKEQAGLWRYGFLLFIPLLAVAAFFVRPTESQPAQSKPTPTTKQQKLNWILLSAIPSSLLLGCTTYLTSNVAPVPLLWVVPLSLYLITFMLAFAGKQFADSNQISRILPLIATPLILPIVIEAAQPLIALAGLHLALLFLGCWMCHARLNEEKPEPSQLTEFFMLVSVGGVLGGIFNSLVAPLVFKTFAEYPLAIFLVLLVRKNTAPAVTKSQALWIRALLPVVVLVVTWIVVSALKMPPSTLRNGLVIGLPLVAAFASVDYRLPYAFGIGSILFASGILQISSQGKILATYRSFFGVHRVVSEKNFISLVHGTTTHGRQSTDPAKRTLPLTYYHPTGPVGQIFNSPRFMRGVKDIGLVGLGVGSLAAYGQPGQTMTYFEIDPEVLYIARDSGSFSFLKDSKATMKYVLGDARLTLAKVPDQSFDLLVLDAFSSDAIPTHLLTLEALKMYKSKLRPGGIIAFHISNRYLDLAPILGVTANKVGLMGWEQIDAPVGEEETDGKTQSNWALLTFDQGPRDLMIKPVYWNAIDIVPGLRPWTDDYSNVLGALKPEGE